MQTWSVKIDDELKEKIQNIAKTDFDNNMDFMNTLINLYEMNDIRESGSVLSGEVEEVQKLANRIVNLFVHANSKVCTTLEDREKLMQSELVSKEDTIKMLHEKLKETELDRNNIANINDALSESNKEHTNEMAELGKSKITLEALVDEYKEKNDTLTGLLQEYKDDREENRVVKADNERMAVQIGRLEAQSDSDKKEILRLQNALNDKDVKHKDEMDKMESGNASLIEAIQNNTATEIEQLKKNLEVEHRLSMLKAQGEHQDRLASISDKHTLQIEKYQNGYDVMRKRVEDSHDEFVKKEEMYLSKIKELEERVREKDSFIE